MAGDGGLACVDLHVLSLLPRTLGSRYDAIVAPGKLSEEKELDAIQCFFKSMASRDRVELTEEAKIVLKKVTDPLNTCHVDGNQVDVVNHTDQLQGRRQALGRKRARFSFKPCVSDPLLNVDPKLSVDHIKDPEEFFSAIEKIEYADKVLKKLRGEVDPESTQNPRWTASRKRRPGILGRRASYKHHFTTQVESAETASLFEGENEAVSPLKSTKDLNSSAVSLSTTQPGTLREGKADGTNRCNASDIEGSTADEEKSVDNILGKLLYCFEEINEGEEIEFLEERLRVKSINVDKICLPPLDGHRGNDLTSTESKRTKDAFGATERVCVSQNVTRSPLASIAVLKRRISQINHLGDPFNMRSPSDSSLENSSSDEGSHLSLKTRSRLHSKRKSNASTIEIQAGMTSPASITLADTEGVHCQDDGIGGDSTGHLCALDIVKDVVSASIEARSGNKVDDILVEASVANEADRANQELHLGTLISDTTGTLAAMVGDRFPCDATIDNGINGHALEIGAINNDKVSDLREEPASTDNGVNIYASCLDDQAETRSRLLSKGKLLASSIHSKAATTAPTKISLADTEGFHCQDDGVNDHCAGHPSALDITNDVVSTSIEASSGNKVEDIIVEPLVANEADRANQELHLETLISDTTGTLSGMVGDRFPCDTTIDNGTNRHALETGAITNEKVSDVREEPSSVGKGMKLPCSSDSTQTAKINSRLSLQEELPASTIHPSLPTPTSITLAHAKGLHCQSDGIADPCTEGVSILDSANVIVPTVIDFSSEDENDGVDPEEFITSEADCQDEDLPLGPINSNTITTSARVLADKVPIDTTLGNSGNAESLEIGDSTKDKPDDVQEGHASNGKEHSSIDGVSNVPVGGCSGNSSVLHEHNTEQENQTSVTSSLEVEAPERRQSKQRKAARRQSLADAGTAWQCGVRRSTRIRTKPLAHWRGERLLYARIHDTLPTVIGLKYASPAKGGQEAPVLRVKSYVSEEYADLVQKVALH